MVDWNARVVLQTTVTSQSAVLIYTRLIDASCSLPYNPDYSIATVSRGICAVSDKALFPNLLYYLACGNKMIALVLYIMFVREYRMGN